MTPGKGKVESGVGHAQKTPLKGQRFESLEQAQAYLDHWEERWADTRIHGTTKRQVAAMFAEEKPALLPLPVEPFRYYLYGERTVHLDGCVEVEAAYYGAPPGWIGRRVHVQWNAAHVREAVRRILCVLNLTKKYGVASTDEACPVCCRAFIKDLRGHRGVTHFVLWPLAARRRDY
jgi:hypothetical protein